MPDPGLAKPEWNHRHNAEQANLVLQKLRGMQDRETAPNRSEYEENDPEPLLRFRRCGAAIGLEKLHTNRRIFCRPESVVRC